MCLNQIYVKNTRKLKTGLVTKDKKQYFTRARISNAMLRQMDDESYNFLRVPCGHCAECASLKQQYLSQRVQLLSLDHYVFFQTLTIKNKFMKYVDVNGSMNKYFDITYFQNYIKMIRKYNVLHAPFKFLAVTEYGKDTHRPHMHILYFVPKSSEYWSKFDHFKIGYIRNYHIQQEVNKLFWDMLHYWRYNHGSTRNPDYEPLLKFVSRGGRRNYDFQFVAEQSTGNNTMNVTHYVTKYVLKFDPWITKKQQAFKLNLSDEEYKEKWRLVRPRLLISKHFGDGEQYSFHMHDMLQYSLDNIKDEKERWFFINIYTGAVVPMAPYLRKKFVDGPQSMGMYLQTKEDLEHLCDDPRNEEWRKRKEHFDKVFMICRMRNSDPDYYEME